ncbi:MAG: carbohydrate kinase family protein [Verrucomicrobia bacterium]|nr:carbohydrate kinase family protein [Verrucomicrobiota bacterium]MCH8528851.1 PfkB family carbohydrate kinase [Kiritimatiellia bacterium]
MSSKPEKLIKAAQQLESVPANAGVLIGFDGFIDEIIRLVDTRTSPTDYTPISTITEFGQRISAAAGLSCNIEMVPEQIKLGGNGPIMANNLVEQGYAVTYCGALGAEGNVNPVFSDFADRCAEVITLCDPGHTDAVEFDDGKVMLGKMNTLPSVNWDNLLAQVPAETLKEKLKAVELIGCVNWTMLTEMNTILQGLGSILKDLPTRKKLFIDLTDPRKRSREDIAKVLSILSDLNKVTDVVLGLNENESVQVAEVLFGHAGDDLTARAQNIRTKLDLFQVVIHPTRSAAVASAEGEWFIEGPYTPKPKLTTGAGDNFNAGYCNGLLSGLSPEGCLITGVSSSGFYVRNCRSATRAEQINFLRAWSDAGGGDMP